MNEQKQQEIIQRMKDAIDTEWRKMAWRTQCPRLSTMAALIESLWPELRCSLEPWETNTDRQIKGTRIRIAGRGRKGYKLSVFVRETGGSWPKPIYTHESGETYRRNTDVAKWILGRIKQQAGKEATP